MGPIDALGHFLNFCLPAWGVAVLGTLIVKLVFRAAVGRARLIRVMLVSALMGTAALALGLMVWERDGRMATYGLLILAEAAVWWWMLVRPLTLSPAAPRRRARSGARPG